MISLQNISFSYRKKPLIQDLSASFEGGKLYGIIGPNGSGKTTLLHLICGLLSPKKGELSLVGQSYAAYRPKDLAKMIGLLPQTNTLPAISVYDFVSRGRYPHLGWSRVLTEADRKAVKNALERAHVSHLSARRADRLSGGELQRVCLALALAQETPYLCLDEPTAFLDIAHRFALLEELKTLKNEGKCVIAVLHDLSLALRYCDQILVLQEGDLKAFGCPQKVLSSGIIEEVFQVECHSLPSEGENRILFLPRKETV